MKNLTVNQEIVGPTPILSSIYGVCSSIGRASVCESGGNGIVTHHTHKIVRNGQGLGTERWWDASG